MSTDDQAAADQGAEGYDGPTVDHSTQGEVPPFPPARPTADALLGTLPGLTEFLLARVAEDEAAADDSLPDDGTAGTWSRWVKAECEAKRRIVESFADAERAVATYDHDNPVPAYWQEWGNRHALASVLESLATVYADHPDYRPEWRP